MYVILQLQHSVGDVSNSTSSTVQSLTELVLFFFMAVMLAMTLHYQHHQDKEGQQSPQHNNQLSFSLQANTHIKKIVTSL